MTREEKSELMTLIGNWCGTSADLIKANQREQEAKRQLENFISKLPEEFNVSL